MATTEEMHGKLKAAIAPIPFADAIAMIDRRGRLLNASRSWPAPDVNVADRDYFKALAAGTGATIFVGAPVRSRASGAWTICLARRLADPENHFLGLILGAVEQRHFLRFFSRIALGEGSAIALYRRDGVMLARHPAGEAPADERIAIGDAFGTLPPSRDFDSVRTTGPVGRTGRIVTMRALAHYPLVIAISRTEEAALQGWRRQALTMGAAAVLLEIVVAGVVLLGARHLRAQDLVAKARARQVEAERARLLVEAELQILEERSRGERAISAQYARFGVALDNMLQGLCMFDRENRLLVSNAQFAAMFGLPQGALLPGRPMEELIRHAMAEGSLDEAQAGALRSRLSGLLTLTQPSSFLWELDTGRTVSVSYRPMEKGGWLATFEDISERRAAEAKIVHMAHHDALTGLPNRIRFHQELGQALARAHRGERCAVLCLDLDRFKDVNDTLGHPAGDALLKSVTERLRNCVRETDLISRLGGDEFAVVQSGVEQPAGATATAQRMIEELSLPFDIGGHQVVIGTSVGIAIAPQDGADTDALLKNADLALYRAKRDGRGVCRFFAPEMDAHMQARRVLELDLRRALAGGEFELFYQPFVDLRSNAIRGFEALIRWRHPQRGLVVPGEFVPLCEEIGLIVPVGEWVLRQACADAVSWPAGMRLAVNLSPAQFRSRSLVQAVASALAASGLAARRLELEITETVVFQDTESTLQTLRQLRDLGVRISLDDFGTGYSSLSYLKKFPFDKIKIDRSFVADLGRKEDSGAIVRAVAALGANLGIQTIAEGIETEEQFANALAEGCTEGQGYLFSVPRPANEVASMFRAGAMAEMPAG